MYDVMFKFIVIVKTCIVKFNFYHENGYLLDIRNPSYTVINCCTNKVNRSVYIMFKNTNIYNDRHTDGPRAAGV